MPRPVPEQECGDLGPASRLLALAEICRMFSPPRRSIEEVRRVALSNSPGPIGGSCPFSSRVRCSSVPGVGHRQRRDSSPGIFWRHSTCPQAGSNRDKSNPWGALLFARPSRPMNSNRRPRPSRALISPQPITTVCRFDRQACFSSSRTASPRPPPGPRPLSLP